MRKLEAHCGEEINSTIAKAISEAKISGDDVGFDFNGVNVVVMGSSSPPLIYRDWMRGVNSKRLLQRLKEAVIELAPKINFTYRQKWERIVPMIHKAYEMAEDEQPVCLDCGNRHVGTRVEKPKSKPTVDRFTLLTENDWLQIEQAASGCIGGTSDEWPALRSAIAIISGKPFVDRKSASWLQGFCEGVMLQSGRVRKE